MMTNYLFNMEKPRFDLLRQLAAHIVSDKRGHATFDYGLYNNGWNSCGTRGCAIGELPILFPNEFIFDGKGVSLLTTGMHRYSSKDSAMTFFGIGSEDYNYIFVPSEGMYIDNRYIANDLADDASAQEVSDHIIKWCDENEPSYS